MRGWAWLYLNANVDVRNVMRAHAGLYVDGRCAAVASQGLIELFDDVVEDEF